MLGQVGNVYASLNFTAMAASLCGRYLDGQ